MRRALIVLLYFIGLCLIIPNFVLADSNVISTFDAPGEYSMGIEYHENILLVTSIINDEIYRVNPTTGALISSFAAPGNGPMDFAWDGSYLWNADYDDDKIYKIDLATETAIETYDSPGEHPMGLAWDGTYLWHTDYHLKTIYKMDTSCNIIATFDAPGFKPQGLAWDGTYLWNADGEEGKIYKLDTSCKVITSFSSPNKYPTGLDWDGTYLWGLDRDATEIYKIDVDFSPWPMWRSGRKHTGVSPYDTSHVDGTIKWRFKTEEGMESSPAIGPDGTIYIGCHDNKLYAIKPDGTEKWSYQVGTGPVYSESGTEQYSGVKGILSSPAVGDNGLIYFTSMSDILIALDLDGNLKWEYPLDTSIDIWSSPLVDEDGNVYVGSHDDFHGKIYAIDEDGNLLYKFEGNGDICSSPAMDENGVIYFGSGSGHLYAFHSSTGQLKWKYPFEDVGDKNAFVDSSPAIGPDGTIYVGCTLQGTLYAIDKDGNYKWKLKLGDSIDTWSSPAIFDGTVYIGSDDGYFYAVDADTGNLEWKYDLVGGGGGSPAIGADGTIYTTCEGTLEGDNFFAFNQQGEKIWGFSETFSASSPAIGSDGTIYIGCWDGLFALSNYSTENLESDDIIPGNENIPWEPAVDDDKTPGFEIIIMLAAISIILFLKKKYC